MTDERKLLVLEPLADDPEVGRWLAALEDARRDTIQELSSVTPEMLDARPDPLLNSIGTLLYHIALIETSWLLDDIFEGEPGPDWLQALLPFSDRDGSGRLIQVDGVPMASHLQRLGAVRQYLLERLRPHVERRLPSRAQARLLRRGARLGAPPSPPARGRASVTHRVASGRLSR